MKIKNPFREKDLERRKHSSNVFKSKESSKKVINERLKIVIAVLCIIFTLFAIRLLVLQVLHQEEWQLKLESFTASEQTVSPPRGKIYDSTGKVLAESVKSLTISYYPDKNTSNSEEWKLAEKFVDEVGVNDLSITDRQLKDMYISYMSDVKKDDLNSLLTKKERKAYKDGELTLDDVYDLKVKAVDVSKIDERLKKILQVKMNMDASPSNEFKTIMSDCSDEQFAYIVEHANSFKGLIGT